MQSLTAGELTFFRNNGYVVVHDAVSPAHCRGAAEALWAFLEMDPEEPETWYRHPALPCVSSVEMYHHQAFWENRQSPRVYGAFADIRGEEGLWVSIDRASFKPPLHPQHLEYDSKGFIHWDDDPAATISQPLQLQGVLCLTDTDEWMGGFQCVPGHHLRLDEWLAARPGPEGRKLEDLSAGSLARAAALSGYPAESVVRLSNSAGDLIIWDHRLPHGNGRNVSLRPRLAQYITMTPAWEGDTSLRNSRVRMWRERTAPPGSPGDRRNWERRHCQPAILSDLGRRLLGRDRWLPVR